MRKSKLRECQGEGKSSPSSPQMNEVAQCASVAEGLSAVLIVRIAADGDREGPLA